MSDVVPTPTPLWRNRDYIALWSGQVVSALGAGISGTAMPLLVLALTGSAANAGIVAAAGSAPYLLSLPVGALVDRWNRRTIMLVSQLAGAAALASIPIALWLHVLTVPHLALVAFVQGTCAAFYGVAETAATPIIVPATQRPLAVAQIEARSRGAAFVGPPLGGLLFSLGRAVPFVADAISYLVAAAGIILIRGRLQGERTGARRSLGHEVMEGLHWLWQVAFARAALMLLAASNVVFQALVLILIVRAEEKGASARQIGLMMGIYGGGGLAGALVAGWLHRLLQPKVVLIAINWVWAALIPLLLLPSNPLLFGVIAGACAFVGPLWNVVIINYQMGIVPEHMMGRVTATAVMVTAGVMPLGSLGAGYLLEGFGSFWALLALTGIMVAVAVAATASRSIRHVPPADDLPALAALRPSASPVAQ